MESTFRANDPLRVASLRDALGMAFALRLRFGVDGDFCALWLGDDDGEMVDLVVYANNRGRDMDRLIQHLVAAPDATRATHAVLWRTVDGIDDDVNMPTMSTAYEFHRLVLRQHQIEVLDEIVIGDDQYRSLALLTASARPGWDDYTELLDDPDGPDDPDET